VYSLFRYHLAKYYHESLVALLACGREVGISLGINQPSGMLGSLATSTKKIMNKCLNVEEEVPSASDLRDMFPGALGWDWQNQEVIPSVWASIQDIETNGWKIIREAAPPALPPKTAPLSQVSAKENTPGTSTQLPGIANTHSREMVVSNELTLPKSMGSEQSTPSQQEPPTASCKGKGRMLP
jgi:hypothetical protein